MTRSNRRPASFSIPPGVVLVLVAVLLYAARDVLIPIALAVLITFLLTPAVRWLERARVPRIAAVLILVAAASAFLGGLGWVVERQAYELAADLPQYKANIRAKFEALRPSGSGVLGRAGSTLAELGRELGVSASSDQKAPEAPLPTAEPAPVRVVVEPTPPLTYARSLLGTALRPLATVGVVVVFVFFMLLKREDLRNRLIRLIGQQQMHLTTPAIDDAAQRITGYLIRQLIVNAAAGLAIGLGLFFLGVPGAAVWGLLTALLRFVPYVGTWVASAMPLAVSLAVSPGWTTPLLALGLILVVEVACANVIEPLLIGAGTGLSPLAVLMAAVFWAWLWGPVGLILATPMTVCLVVIGRHVPGLKFLDIVLRDEPGLEPDAQFYQRLLAGDQGEAEQIVARYAKDKPVAEVFDGIVLPAMRLAEADRHRGDLDGPTEAAVRDMLGAVVEDLGGPRESSENRSAPRPGPVLCLPARDWADELASDMLALLLTDRGLQASVLSAESLSGELVDQVAALSPVAVCVSAVPPAAAVHFRVLCKRLRARFPELPIVAGLWDGREDVQAVRLELGAIGTDHVATTLSGAAEILRRLATEASPKAGAVNA